jgi:outer membrane protein assembly factor BamB
MTNTTHPSTSRRALRLWPAVIIATTLVALRYLAPLVAPDAEILNMPVLIIGVISGVALAAAIVLWWLFFSRAPWLERIGTVIGIVAALAVTRLIIHESIRGGMMGNMLWVYSAPLMAVALVAAAAATRRLDSTARRTAIALAIILTCGGLTLVRTDGVTGDGQSQLHWRWTPTREQLLLAQGGDAMGRDSAPPTATATAPRASCDVTPAAGSDESKATRPAAAPLETPAAAETKIEPVARDDEDKDPVAAPVRAEWPGFRGPSRDAVIHGTHVNTDWSSRPPVEIWRRQIGPGWSSFAVSGDLIYTQEQRGDAEIVACYRLSTGEPVWVHRDAARFWESNGGPGPRGTPTLSAGRVYTLGATGILNALDAASGQRIWSHNAATDTGVTVPDWGVTSSPLIIGDVVIVAISGQLVGYEATTGKLRWIGPKGGAGYSSPHLLTLNGVAQIVLLRGSRTISVDPKDGALLWEHVWQPGVGIVQPGITADGLLISTGDAMGGLGIRRVAVTHKPEGWQVEERWTTRGLKPYFNDFVIHKGHAYGFDGSILAAIDLSDGTRKWKGGRYGSGQMVLLAEQDLLLVVSEDGEIALVGATPDKFTELARLPVLNAKTWNHPVLVNNILVVRNGEEMAAIRLPQ